MSKHVYHGQMLGRASSLPPMSLSYRPDQSARSPVTNSPLNHLWLKVDAANDTYTYQHANPKITLTTPESGQPTTPKAGESQSNPSQSDDEPSPTSSKWAHIPGFDKLPPETHNGKLYERLQQFDSIRRSHYSKDGYSMYHDVPSYIEDLCEIYFGTRERPVLDEDYLRQRRRREQERRERRDRFRVKKNFMRRGTHLPRHSVYLDEPLFDDMPSHNQKERTHDHDDADDEYGDDDHHRSTKRKRAEKDDTTHHSRKKRARDAVNDEHDRKSKRQRNDKAPRSGGATSSAPKSSYSPPGMDEETAFREALFDAMADDEGAAYWENLYGQPLHIYPRAKVNPQTGILEQMTDDEYAAYVRQKMWEKTHSGYLEAQMREQQQRRQRVQDACREAHLRHQREEEERRRAEEKRRMQEEIERTLRRAEERKKNKSGQAAFAEYTTRRQDWDGSQATIPWPTESGRPKGLSEKTVRSFFLRGLDLKALGTKEFNAQLKEHRVRWHPDKMEQKMGGRGKVDKGIMADITMIFQVIDTLYNDTRKSK